MTETANTDALVIVAKYPAAGHVKTRLGASIGMQAAANLYRAFLDDLRARFGGAAAARGGYTLQWACLPDGTPQTDDAAAGLAPMATLLGADARLIAQHGVDFAARLYAICRDVQAQGYRRMLILGSDSPHLDPQVAVRSFALLDAHDVVLGPAEDGGYYLIGLHLPADGQPPLDLFSGIEMSTARVLAETLQRAQTLGCTVALLAPTFDVDEVGDIERLERALLAQGSARPPATWHALAALREQQRAAVPARATATTIQRDTDAGESASQMAPRQGLGAARARLAQSTFTQRVSQPAGRSVHVLQQEHAAIPAVREPLAEEYTPLPLPRELYIESTTRCNEHCDQCPRTHLGREADRDITLGEVQQIVEQFPTLDRVVLHGLGEPLMNRELPQIIRYLRGRGTYVLFNSNALLLDAKRGQSLIDAGLNELRISLDGATPATYARVRGVNLRALPLIIKNLAAFEALKRANGADLPRTSLWFTAMRENFEELPQVVEIAAQTGVPEVYVQRFIYFGKGLATAEQSLFRQAREQEQDLLTAAEARCRTLGIAFKATGATEPAVYLGRGQQVESARPWAGCQRPTKLAYITAHGNVYSCCFAPFTAGPSSEKLLGNAFTTPFEQVWNGERYRAFRAAFASDTPWRQCADCGTLWSL